MIFRVIGGVISAAILLWGILPLFSAVVNVGAVSLIVIGTVGLYTCVRFPTVARWICQLWDVTAGRAILIAAAVLVALLVLVFVIVTVNMIRANDRAPSENATVVVLGAAIRGDQPSRSLRTRLDAAVEYLSAHPSAACIVSGGQGRDEVCTEASVMRAYLIRAGIAPDRIYVEDRSTSTYENIVFSQEIIEEHGLSPQIALATQEFHQYRAQRLAEKAGFREVGAVTAYSRPDLLGCYWMRDFFGVCHMFLFGE